LDTRENVAPTSAFSARAISETKSRGKETAWQTTRLNTGLLAFVSGFATFALQVLWNRAFAQLHENSMYSFSVIVAVTIAALAVGAQFARVGLKRVLMPLRLLSVAWIFGGAAIVGSPWLFIHFSHGFAYLTTGAGWAAEASRLVALAGGLLLVPMALVGIGFPVLMECVGGDEVVSSARSLGRICTVNVVGSIVGSLVSGFLLPRWLGLWNSMIGLGIILIAIGVIEFAGNRQRRPYLIFTYVVIGMAVVFLVGISGLDLPRVSVETAANERLVAISEGPHGITAVVERPGSRRLKLNNHYGLGGTASTGDERMQAHIPLLLHPSPHRVAFLGLGTGITAGGALFHPVDQVTVIELVPDVISAARIYFHDANQGVIDNDRTHMIADDARHALRNGAARYDVIVGDLVVPWREGEGSLFTLEQFQAARTALAPNGIFCQWLPLFQLSETEANIIFRTFLQVFPHAQVWRGDFSPSEPAIALIGSNADMRLDAENIRRRISQMRADPTNPQMESPEDFWMNFIGELDATKLDGNELRLNLDDQPWVEILGPLRHTGASDGKVFTGRALQKWERALTQSSQAQLNTLPPTQAAAVRAGDTLAEMTLCLYEQNTAGAKAAQSKLREELPEPAFRRLF
jgi:spermidine synthase